MNKYIATYAETAFSGIGIIEIEYGIEDYVISEVIKPTAKHRTHRNVICYTAEGRPFFNINRKRYYLDEFVKTNI